MGVYVDDEVMAPLSFTFWITRFDSVRVEMFVVAIVNPAQVLLVTDGLRGACMFWVYKMGGVLGWFNATLIT